MPSAVFVGAHPDDVEIGAAVLARRLAAAGWETYEVVVTAGEKSRPRPVEWLPAAVEVVRRELGFREVVVLDVPDSDVRRGPDLIDQIEVLLERFSADALITHHPLDVHHDHAAVAAAALEAGRDLPAALSFELPSFPRPSPPHFILPITERELELKVALIREFRPHKIGVVRDGWEEAVRVMARSAAIRLRAAGVRYAEAFWVHRIVGSGAAALCDAVRAGEVVG